MAVRNRPSGALFWGEIALFINIITLKLVHLCMVYPHFWVFHTFVLSPTFALRCSHRSVACQYKAVYYTHLLL